MHVDMPRPLFFVCILLVFALGAAIAAVNPQALRVELLFAEVELTRGQWLIVAFLCGWLAGVLSASACSRARGSGPLADARGSGRENTLRA